MVQVIEVIKYSKIIVELGNRLKIENAKIQMIKVFNVN